MKAVARDLLKREMSPASFQRVRSYWWYGKFYLPRCLASIVIRRTPVVHGPPSELVTKLRNINTFAPTPMCRVMTGHGSDKGNSWHNYTAVYSALFGPLRGKKLRIFELGLGTNNPEWAFNMGVDGRPGASLRGWRDIFPEALVFGADIDRSVLFTEDRIQTFYCDQLDSAVIHDLWAQPPLQSVMDIIIDDGLHTFQGNVSFLLNSLNHLRVGGYYVAEDIRTDELGRWQEHLPIYEKQFPNFDFALVVLPNPFNHSDNNQLVIQRRS